MPAQVDGVHDPGFVLRTDFDGDGCDDLLIRDRVAWHGWFGARAAPWFRAGGSTTSIQAMPTGAPVVGPGGLVFEPAVGGSIRRHVGGRVEVRSWRPQPDGSVALVDLLAVGVVAADRNVTAPVLLPLPDDLGVLLAWSEVSLQVPALLRMAVLRPDRSLRDVTLPLDGPAPAGAGWLVRSLRLVDPGQLLGLPGRTVQVLLSGQAGDLAALSVQVSATASGLPEPTGFRVWRGTPAPVPDEFRRTLGGVAQGGFVPSPAFGGHALAGWDGWLLGVPDDFAPPYAQLPGTAIRVPSSLRFLHGASADYDGDGADEAVALVAGLRWRHDLLLLLDPYPHALGAQGLLTPPGGPAWFGTPEFAVRHGAPADIDGDGRLDLALVLVGAQPGRCRLALMRGEPDPAGGQRLSPSW